MGDLADAVCRTACTIVAVFSLPALASAHDSPAYFDVSTYGAVPDDRSDSTYSINTALDAFRTYTGRRGSAVLYFPPGTYRVTSSLNFTGIRARGVTIEMAGATIDPQFSGGTVIDALGSRYVAFDGVHIESKGQWVPDVGFAVGRVDRNVADVLTINNLTVVGSFSKCAIYNRASETDLWLHPVSWNSSPSGYSYCGDGINHFGVLSRFMEDNLPVDQPESFNENTIITGDFRQSAGHSAVWLAGAGRHSFIGSYLAVTGGSACGATFYFPKNPHVTVGFLNWDVHEEAIGSLAYQICFDGVNENLVENGLIVRDHFSEAGSSIFHLLIPGGQAQLTNLNLSIGGFCKTAVVFDQPSLWAASGEYHLPERATQWNLPSSAFKGSSYVGLITPTFSLNR
jgi:hypothetical protein